MPIFLVIYSAPSPPAVRMRGRGVTELKKAPGLPVPILFFVVRPRWVGSPGASRLKQTHRLQAIARLYAANQCNTIRIFPVGVHPWCAKSGLTHPCHMDGSRRAKSSHYCLNSIQRAAFSAIISVGELVLPLVMTGMAPASTTRKPATRPPGPRTRK